MCAQPGHIARVTHSPPRDGAIAALAARQGGVIGRGQLHELGLSSEGIRARLRRGTLHRWGAHVFVVGHPHLERTGRLWAALLAAGPGAVLSHRTAAALWDLRPSARTRIEVTVQGGGRRGDQGLQIHRVRFLSAEDVTEHTGLRVTTPARTLLDLADVLDATALDRAIERALMLRRFDAEEVRRELVRANGRRGAKRLRTAVSGTLDRPPKTRSDLERDFLAFCRTHHLPTPTTNVVIEGFEVDAHFPGTRLIVELDGRRTHGTPHAFERDRRRDRTLAVAGYIVVRVTERQLEREPHALAADLAELVQTSPKSRTTWVASIPSTSAAISPR